MKSEPLWPSKVLGLSVALKMTWLGLAYQEEHMQTSGGALLCFAPPSLLSSEEEPMDTGTIRLTPHPKNENTDGEKGSALLW